MKKILYIFLIAILFFTCQKSPTEDYIDAKIDAYLNFADNQNINTDKRIKYIDSANVLILTKHTDSLKIKKLFRVANRYFHVGAKYKYKKTSQKLVDYSYAIDDSTNLAKALQYMGDYYIGNSQYDSAYFSYKKSEKYYKLLKDDLNTAIVVLCKGNIQYLNCDYVGAEVSALSVLKFLKEIQSYYNIFSAYTLLGNVACDLGEFEKSLEYHELALNQLKNYNRNDQEGLKAVALSNIGLVYERKKDYNKAISSINQAMNVEDVYYYDLSLYASLKDKMGYCMFKLSPKNSSSKKLIYESLKINNSLNFIPRVIINKLHLSELYIADKDTFMAYKHAIEALKLSREKYPIDNLDCLKQLAIIDPKNASQYAQEFIKISDSLQLAERKARNKFARIEYETEEVILEKNTAVKQKWIVSGVASIAILFVVLLLVIKTQRSRQKEFRLLQDQQQANQEIYNLMLEQQTKIDEGRQSEKKRIARDLHDGIMNKLASTRLNLFILNKKNDPDTVRECIPHISGIQDIEKEIRHIAHDLNQEVFSTTDSFRIIVETLFDQQKSTTEATFHIEIDPAIKWEALEGLTKIHIYRILQESIQNSIKHSGAQNIVVSMIHSRDAIAIEISDDGTGFDNKKIKEGIGLKNMKSRIKEIHGKMEMSSNKGEGTKIKLQIPV